MSQPAVPPDIDHQLAIDEIHRIGTPANLGQWEYSRALFCLGLLKIYQRTGDHTLLDFVRTWVDLHLDPQTGLPDHATDALDFVEPGNLLLALWHVTGEQRYRRAYLEIAADLATYPTTGDGALYHATNHGRQNQLWLDGSYMAMPFLARTGDANRAVRQLLLYHEHLKDPAGPLYFHAYDAEGHAPWLVAGTMHSCCKWARAQGWYAMALVDVLDATPPSTPHRTELISILAEMAHDLEHLQDAKTGLWYQLIDRPQLYGNFLETSSSAMFSYALHRAAQRGYISPRYLRCAERGLAGLKSRLRNNADATLSLTSICIGTNVGDLGYYLARPQTDDDMHGLGAFFLAFEEVQYSNHFSHLFSSK